MKEKNLVLSYFIAHKTEGGKMESGGKKRKRNIHADKEKETTTERNQSACRVPAIGQLKLHARQCTP